MNRPLRALLAVFVVMYAANAWAQATAQINGTVTDSSGAILPGVTVTATHMGTGVRREAVTDATGSYSLLNLPLGQYRLDATLQGFRTYAQTGIVLQVNSNPVIPITLQLGSLEETVSVEAAAPLVETRNPSIGGVVTNEQVEALPLEGRNPTALIVLAGAAADTGPPTSRSMTTSRGIAITGGQPFAVSYLLDGAMHNNVLDGLNLPLPFPDALQEFSVETSSQNAQNGVGRLRGGGQRGRPGQIGSWPPHSGLVLHLSGRRTARAVLLRPIWPRFHPSRLRDRRGARRTRGRRSPFARCSMLDARCSMLDARCSMLDARRDSSKRHSARDGD